MLGQIDLLTCVRPENMEQPLFRREALQFIGSHQYGIAAISQPVALSICVIAFAIMLAAALVFCSIATFRESHAVRGIVSPVGGTVKVFPNATTGVYERILVKEGDLVGQGDILATVHSMQRDRQGSAIEADMLRIMEQNRQELQEALVLEERKYQDAQVALAERMRGMRAQLVLLKDEHAALASRVELAAGEYERRKELVAKRLISIEELNAKHSAYLAILQQERGARVRIEEQARQLREQEAAARALPIDHGQRLIEQNSRLTQLELSIAERRQRSESTLVAPTAGRVSAISAVAGDAVNPRAPLMTIVSPDQPLEAEVYVPARAAGQITAGQTIRVKYDAFPYQTYGTYVASIRTISDTVIDPREFPLATQVNEPVYIVRANLQEQQVRDRNEPVLLQAGMSFTGDIVTSEQTLLRWIFDPVLKLAGNL